MILNSVRYIEEFFVFVLSLDSKKVFSWTVVFNNSKKIVYIVVFKNGSPCF